MPIFTAPDPLNGDALAAELRAAGIDVDDGDVLLSAGQLRVNTDAAEADVQAVLDAHTGQPTADQQARDSREVNLQGAVATLRQWADDAESTEVTQGNAVQVLNVVVDRLGVFFDRFADLLEQRYPQG